MDRREFLKSSASASAAFTAAQAAERRGESPTSCYAIVELMGFKRLCGRLSKGDMGMWQLEVPVEGGFVTKLINPASVYCITVTSGEAVRDAARTVDPMPAIELEVRPTQRHLGWEDDDREPY